MKEEVNGRQISEKAIIKMSSYIEDYIIAVTKKGLEILEEKNRNYEIQGLRKTIRLDEDSIEKGIRIINHEGILQLPVNQEGGKQKEGKKYVKHTQKNRQDQGVEII